MSFLYEAALLFGRTNVTLLYVPLKAFAPTPLSLVDFIVTFFRFLHDTNALLPMLVTLFPITTLVSIEYLLNAFAPTDVILNFTPPITTASEIVKDANFLSDLVYVVPEIATVPVPLPPSVYKTPIYNEPPISPKN